MREWRVAKWAWLSPSTLWFFRLLAFLWPRTRPKIWEESHQHQWKALEQLFVFLFCLLQPWLLFWLGSCKFHHLLFWCSCFACCSHGFSSSLVFGYFLTSLPLSLHKVCVSFLRLLFFENLNAHYPELLNYPVISFISNKEIRTRLSFSISITTDTDSHGVQFY